MSGSPVFEWACALLENNTTMNRLQARGTLRLVLGSVGLDTATLTARQLRVVASKRLAKELRSRAIANADQLCEALTVIPPEVEQASGPLHPTPEDVFKRLGRKHD
jgi:hypothetical protein